MLNPIRQIGDRLSQGWQAQSPIDSLRALGAVTKPWLRDGWAELLARAGATSPARFARGALTILTFHHVLPADELRQYPIPGLALTPEQLEQVLSELAPHFECSSVIEAYRRWRKNGARPSRPLLGISFDDGTLDNYEHARPVLERLGLRASFYVPVANVRERRALWHDRLGFALLRSIAAVRKRGDVDFDALLSPFGLSVSSFAAILPDDALRLAAQGVASARRLPAEQRQRALDALEAALGGDRVPDVEGMMSADQLRELHRAGHEIGSHWLTHPLLSAESDARLQAEVEASRRELSDLIGAPVASFCHPGGSNDGRLVQAAQATGYECAVTTRWGLNRKESAAFELARCDMDFQRLRSRRGDFSKERLWLRLSGLQPGLARRAQPESPSP